MKEIVLCIFILPFERWYSIHLTSHFIATLRTSCKSQHRWLFRLLSANLLNNSIICYLILYPNNNSKAINSNGRIPFSRRKRVSDKFFLYLRTWFSIKTSLVSNQEDNIKDQSQPSSSLMNPSQSESFWKDLIRNDIECRRGPREVVPTNHHCTRRRPTKHRPTPKVPPCLLAIKKMAFEWEAGHEQQLFALHRQLGNKWSTIAARLGADDNAVKNKFYSTLRRGLRRLNKYIETIRRSRSATHLASNKYIKAEMLVKVNAVADRTHQDKYEVKQLAVDVSQEIQRGLIELARTEAVYEENLEGVFVFEEGLLEKIQAFNRNCKRRKGKRKVKPQEGEDDSSDHIEEEIEVIVRADQTKVVADKELAARIDPFIQTTPPPISVPENAEDRFIAMVNESKFRNQEVEYSDGQGLQQKEEVLIDLGLKEREGEGEQIEARESTTSSGFDIRLLQSQEWVNLMRNRMLLESTPNTYTSQNFAEIAKSFSKNNLGISASYTFNSLKESTEINKFILERIPSISKKYNAEHALYNSCDIRRELNNFEGTPAAKQKKQEQKDKQ